MKTTNSDSEGTKQAFSMFEAKVEAEGLQEVYLGRLQRLLRLRRDHEEQLNELGVRLLDRSIFAAYCDCLDIGAGFSAQELLRQVGAKVDGASLEKAS